MNDRTTGYLYVATGDRYLQEANVSAQSLRNSNGYANITLITDREIKAPLFDKVIVCPEKSKNYLEGLLYKAKHIYSNSPYEKTLFVDTDTYFCEDCQSLFKLLDFFDIAMAPDPTDPNKAYSSHTNKQLVGCSPYNTGVILFKKNSNNDYLFEQWKKIYEFKINNKEIGKENDQTSFMEAWLKSNSKIYVLSHAWNARTPFFFTLNQSVKIIHGRHRNHEAIKTQLNQPHPSKHRCWIPIEDRCRIKKQGWVYLFKSQGKKIKDKFLNRNL